MNKQIFQDHSRQKACLRRQGFTLIELLVVISIIGLLSTLAVVSLNNARSKSRDAKRVADIKQVQSALELYFNDQNGYPVAASAITLGVSPNNVCLNNSVAGFTTTAGCTGTVYMGSVPRNATPNGSAYLYTAAAASTYTLTFTLEGATGQLAAGLRTATPAGIQ